MIFPKANFDVKKDDQGLYFDSEDVDLDKESLVVPATTADGMGTMEFFRRHVVYHPANGDSKTIEIDEFIKLLLKNKPPLL